MKIISFLNNVLFHLKYILPFEGLGSGRFIYLFLKEINTLFDKETFNLPKITVRFNIMLQNIYTLNKYCSFEHSIHLRILKKLY